jgi:ribose 5-phosphate isomerase B
MRIALGADHAGFALKGIVKGHLVAAGYDVQDLGAHDPRPSDYPDFAEAVGNAVSQGDAERGILICGSGVGAVVSANKIPGVRAGLCHDHSSAHQGVEHDAMNVLALGARVVGEALALDVVDASSKRASRATSSAPAAWRRCARSRGALAGSRERAGGDDRDH